MNLEKIFNEALGGLWNSKSYGGTSDPPRKDFGPQSSQYGYNFPYQKNAPPIWPPTNPAPDAPTNLAWPLQTITNDMADSFTYLLAAINKMENCVRLNTALELEQKKHLKHLIDKSVEVLSAIKQIDSDINYHFNLSGQTQPINPHQEKDPNLRDVPTKKD